jgi:hypothetical protein
VTVNPKPNAGADQILACANAATNTLTTSTTLVPTPTGGTWTQIGTTPATATFTGNNVSGMTIAGTYLFVYTLNGCNDTVAVTVQPCAGCVKPNAGNDQAVCSPATTAKLTAVTAGGTWAPIGSPTNPAPATIDAFGNVAGMAVNGTYRFVYSVTSGGQTCTDTAQVVRLASPLVGLPDYDICPGEILTFGFQGLTGVTYLWNTGAVTATVSVSPTVTTTYSVIVTSVSTGCVSKDTLQVVVHPKPDAGKDTLVCTSSVKLSVATAGQTWSFLSFNNPNNPSQTESECNAES